jgi:hypothetical protein
MIHILHNGASDVQVHDFIEVICLKINLHLSVFGQITCPKIIRDVHL